MIHLQLSRLKISSELYVSKNIVVASDKKSFSKPQVSSKEQ